MKKYLIDLDGTIYRGNELVEYAKEFVDFLVHAGIKFLFVTNCPEKSAAESAEKLKSMGINVDKSKFINSGMATVRFVKNNYPCKKAYVIGTDWLKKEFIDNGIKISEDYADIVVLGFDRTFDYEKMKLATIFIGDGAEFIVTNSDDSIPSVGEKSLKRVSRIPHTGAFAAAIQTATGVNPIYIGKPEVHMLDLACELLTCDKNDVCMVGDRVDTDMAFALNNELFGYLVLNGSQKPEIKVENLPYKVFNSLAEIIEIENKYIQKG